MQELLFSEQEDAGSIQALPKSIRMFGFSGVGKNNLKLFGLSALKMKKYLIVLPVAMTGLNNHSLGQTC